MSPCHLVKSDETDSNHHRKIKFINTFKKIDPVVQLVRMPPCHGGGRGFESRPDRKSLKLFLGDFFLMKFYVYILYYACIDVYYKGFSTDVEKRLEYHLNSQHKFTSKAKDWIIVYVQEFSEKTDALLEEKRLKILNRNSIEKLIG